MFEGSIKTLTISKDTLPESRFKLMSQSTVSANEMLFVARSLLKHGRKVVVNCNRTLKGHRHVFVWMQKVDQIMLINIKGRATNSGCLADKPLVLADSVIKLRGL
jgi:hypothetical protein